MDRPMDGVQCSIVVTLLEVSMGIVRQRREKRESNPYKIGGS
jgi:hypothetical protein